MVFGADRAKKVLQFVYDFYFVRPDLFLPPCVGFQWKRPMPVTNKGLIHNERVARGVHFLPFCEHERLKSMIFTRIIPNDISGLIFEPKL